MVSLQMSFRTVFQTSSYFWTFKPLFWSHAIDMKWWLPYFEVRKQLNRPKIHLPIEEACISFRVCIPLYQRLSSVTTLFRRGGSAKKIIGWWAAKISDLKFFYIVEQISDKLCIFLTTFLMLLISKLISKLKTIVIQVTNVPIFADMFKFWRFFKPFHSLNRDAFLIEILHVRSWQKYYRIIEQNSAFW